DKKRTRRLPAGSSQINSKSRLERTLEAKTCFDHVDVLTADLGHRVTHLREDAQAVNRLPLETTGELPSVVELNATKVKAFEPLDGRTSGQGVGQSCTSVTNCRPFAGR